MVLDSGEVFMDQVEGCESVGNRTEPDVRADPPKPTTTSSSTTSSTAAPRTPTKRSNVAKKGKVSHNGLMSSSQVVERLSSSSRGSGGGATPKPPLRRPLSLDMTPQRLRGSQEQMADRRIMQPPWRSGSAAPSPPARSLTSPSLGAGGWMRRSESTCSVNYSLGLRAGRGKMRPATSLPHIAKGVGTTTTTTTTLPTSSRPCLLVALRPLNLEQEKQTFFQSDYKYEPQFEYMQPEPRSVLEKYREGSGLFLEQAVGIMECVLRKFGSYENFEEVTGGNVLPKSQVWAAVRKYLQKEGCVGEVVVRLSDELLSQAVMVVESCRPTLTINLAGARQHWLEGMLRHEIGTHYLRGVNNNLQPWSTSEGRKKYGLKPANPTEEGLASLHSVLLRKQPYLWRAALLYYTVYHATSMSFSQLFSHIARFVQDPDVRWDKDQVYLDGILRILRHRRNIDFKMLTSLGKVSYEDVERLRPLAVSPRTRIPHFMRDQVRYLQHLDHIVAVNELDDSALEDLLP
ncbi:hypothetical protein D9C73_004503 [Collichthys lucidus]|uniref:KIAA0895-like n=1 Tax=Collichthys lucidus TaxID=240159 RepID=A0A4U5U7X7_COLLU|nr:hypothetical protein D9C73_004503 [Collichthys lucidus]